MNAPRDANTAFARALVDEWARSGVVHACIAPGSRSTPMALALASDGRITVHVSLDERSAAFLALGIGRASGVPAVVLCTSGTAAANFHPAVLEAFHGRVPLLVATADRPPELQDTGAGQTIDQRALFGGALRWAVDAGPPTDVPDAGAVWRSIGARSVIEAIGPPAGPVHLNLAFREPLVPTGAPLVDAPGRADGRAWTVVEAPPRVADAATIARVADAVRAAPRGAVVAGWGAAVDPAVMDRFAAAAGWPVLADPISGARAGGHAISTYDALLRDPAFADANRPDLVVRVGAPTTGKVVNRWLGGVPQIVVDPDGSWLDPTRGTASLVAVDPGPFLDAVADALPAPVRSWCDDWLGAERAARAAVDTTLDAWTELAEPRVARDVVAAAPDGATVVVASSMPVRDVESFAAPRAGITITANRGVNGIDGFVSTVLGIATASSAPTVALVGDLCFLHDANGLLGAAERDVDAVFVVVDNGGGGIFHFLPQSDESENFETLFGTPQGVDLAALAAVHDIPVTEVRAPADVIRAVRDAIAARGVRIVLARTDRVKNVEHHREVWAAVASAVSQGS